MAVLPILVTARWIHFAALFFLFGAPLCCALARGIDRAGAAQIDRKTDRLLRVSAILAVGSGLVWIASIIANMAGSFADAATVDTLDAFFLQTPFGPVVIIRLVLLAAAMLALTLPLQVRLNAWMVIAAGLLIDQAWLGHAANGGATLFGALMIGVYALHVLAGAAWIGGLPVLLIALAMRSDAPAGKAKILLAFSAMAAAAVTLIVLSGLANALFRVHGHVTRLIGTAYGDILLIKIGLMLIMLVFAAYNRFIALPRTEKITCEGVAPKLSVSIAIELALGVAVIGAAALLGVTPPPD